MSRRPAYAKAKGPPMEWWRLVVLDAVTREEIPQVIEANAAEGWIVQRTFDTKGDKAELRTERAIVICDSCRDPDARNPAIPLDPPYEAA